MESKMGLSTVEVASVEKAQAAVQEDFLSAEKKRSNVVGMGIGVKWKKGQPTGEPAG